MESHLPSTADEDLTSLLQELRPVVEEKLPHLRSAFDIYAAEAVFARKWLAPHLVGLPSGARILEVGAGLMLLTCQLAREGYDVVALEPVGAGFSNFHALQAVVREYARSKGIEFTVLPIAVEQLDEASSYDLAFSINVMEHVADVGSALRTVTRALKPDAVYAFICANYTFPYEPHFGIPIIGSKRLTGLLFGRVIRNSSRVMDPVGTWESLNWISASLVNRTCRQLSGVQCRFDRSTLARTLERATRDVEFARRQPRWLVALSRVMVRTRLHRLTAALPSAVLPLIDCTVLRK